MDDSYETQKFSESSNHSFVAQGPALKFKVDASNIFFNRQKAATRKPASEGLHS
jgi:hypothetical protein